MKQKVIIITVFCCITFLLSGCQRPVASDTHFRLLETESLSNPVLEWAQSQGEDFVVSLARKPLSSTEEIYYVYMNRRKISGLAFDVSDSNTLNIETTPLKSNEVPEDINEDYFHIFQANIKPVEYVSIDGVEMEASSLDVIVTEQQKVQTESDSVSTVGGAGGPQEVRIREWSPTPYATVNNVEDVTMAVREGTVSSTELTLTFSNNSNSQYTIGMYFSLEKMSDGRWYQVSANIDPNYGFNEDVVTALPPNGGAVQLVDWEWLYGTLDTGEYRIIKDISGVRDDGDSDRYYLAAEFVVD